MLEIFLLHWSTLCITGSRLEMQITTSVPEQLLYFNDWLAGKLKCFKAKSPQISGCSSAAVRIRCFPLFYIIVSWLSLGFWSDERRLDTILVKQTILNIRLLMPLQNRIKFFLHTALEKKKSLKTNIFLKIISISVQPWVANLTVYLFGFVAWVLRTLSNV